MEWFGCFLRLPQNSLQAGSECGLDGGREKAIPGAGRPGLSCYPGCATRRVRSRAQGDLSKRKRVPKRICRQRAQPRSAAHSQTAWVTQATDTGRTTGAHSKGSEEGEVVGGDQEVLEQTRPSSAKVARPVRTRHQSTRKRRATATRICLRRDVPILSIFARAHFTT